MKCRHLHNLSEFTILSEVGDWHPAVCPAWILGDDEEEQGGNTASTLMSIMVDAGKGFFNEQVSGCSTLADGENCNKPG